MLVMRTYAIYNRARWVLYLLLSIIAVGGGLSVVCYILSPTDQTFDCLSVASFEARKPRHIRCVWTWMLSCHTAKGVCKMYSIPSCALVDTTTVLQVSSTNICLYYPLTEYTTAGTSALWWANFVVDALICGLTMNRTWRAGGRNGRRDLIYVIQRDGAGYFACVPCVD